MTERCRILVADDDADAAHALAELLKLEGHATDAAVGAQDMQAQLAASAYDVTFVDTSLPGRSDVESFFTLTARRGGKRNYLMTGYSLSQLLGQTARSGGGRMLSGPITAGAILATMQEAGSDGIVLVASHGADAGRELHDVLLQSEYAVAHVTEAADARAQIDERRVHVLILDLGLRLIDALGVYVALQAERRAKPTIIISGGANSPLDDPVTTGIITKPYDPRLLIEQIGRLAA
ncbi:MAG: response regulator [Hyphomicrobiales bacterium]